MGIDVITADPSPTLALQNVFQACTNAVSWRDHEHASPLGPAGLITSANNKPIVQHEGSKTRALLPSFDPLTHEACLVQQFALSDGRVFVDVRLVGENDPQMSLDGEWTPEEVAWTFGYDKSWYLLPPTNVICSESCATVREIPNHQ